jgi:hypothetical protein
MFYFLARVHPYRVLELKKMSYDFLFIGPKEQYAVIAGPPIVNQLIRRRNTYKLYKHTVENTIDNCSLTVTNDNSTSFVRRHTVNLTHINTLTITTPFRTLSFGTLNVTNRYV